MIFEVQFRGVELWMKTVHMIAVDRITYLYNQCLLKMCHHGDSVEDHGHPRFHSPWKTERERTDKNHQKNIVLLFQTGSYSMT